MLVLSQTQGQYIEYIGHTPNPRHQYIYYYTLNTPSQMQRECNDVAFGELMLSTRLKHKHENDTSKVRNRRCHQSVQLLNLSMLMISSTRGYCLHNRTSTNSPSLHKPVHQLLKYEPCFGDLNLTITLDVSNQPNGEENERSLLQDGKQEDDKVMTTNKRHCRTTMMM